MSAPRLSGIGVITAIGESLEQIWSAALDGRTGISLLDRFDPTRYPSALAGQVRDFHAPDRLSGLLIPQTDRVTQLALIASDHAIDSAALDTAGYNDAEMGVVTSNATGGFEFTHREIRKLWTKGPEHVSVYESFAWFNAANTGQISIRHGLRGPGGVVVSEQAGGIDAVAHAVRAVHRGTPLMVTGGVESSLDPWGWTAHLSTGHVSTQHDPALSYLPFCAPSTGYVPGEGGAILVVENDDDARARSAPNYGYVRACASSFDPRESTGGTRLPEAIYAALHAASLSPGEIDVVFADAHGDSRLDAVEVTALAKVFGANAVPVTAPKSLTGRLYGGAAVDIVWAALTLQNQIIPPTHVPSDRVNCDGLDLVLNQPRPAEVANVLVVARGRGGHNAALILSTDP